MGEFRIAAHARCALLHNPGVHRFYRLDNKKKETTADSKSKGKNTGYTCDLYGQ